MTTMLCRSAVQGRTPRNRTHFRGAQVSSKSTPECVTYEGGGVVLQYQSEAINWLCWLWGPLGGSGLDQSLPVLCPGLPGMCYKGICR